jgi:hypothetical protein
LAGGAAGLVVAAGTGAAVWRVSSAEAQVALESADDEIARLQGLVDLYENLERVGLDAILQTGMTAVALPMEGVELGAKALKRGLEIIEDALLSVSEVLPSAQESLLWIEDRVEDLASGVSSLEEALGKALERITDNPVAEALEEFARMILDNLPFGLGDRIRGVLEGFVRLVTSVDDLILEANTKVFVPLRENWFSTEDGQGIGGTLLVPLVTHVLDPLEDHLGSVALLVDDWQAKLTAPTRIALEERASVREEILRYKEEHGFDI